MKRPITNALATLMMVFLVATTAHSVDLTSQHIFGYDGVDFVETCSVCHATNTPTAAAANNVCLVCHKTGSPYASNKLFFKGDMANPFGTSVGEDAPGYTHSSHEWSATDNNPAAGALPPTNSSMFSRVEYNGLLSCNRCHMVHQYEGSVQKPLLRVTNNQDSMCLDCHRLRNTQSHLYGTHAVNVGYTTAVRKNPAGFYNPPINTNPANPTSDLALKLNSQGGQLLCTTCHGVHYTDSTSRTLDNRSTALRGGLEHSKGYLLKTDYRSAGENLPNICTNCHAGKAEHNGGNQHIQCTDCHSGHVDYDPNAFTAQDRVPNVYLVKRYMNWSSSTGWKDNRKLATPKQTFYQDASNEKLFKRVDGKGVCQACHDVPPAGEVNGKEYPWQHGASNFEDAHASQCITCHNHQIPAAQGGSFASSCQFCHGQPPTGSTKAPGYEGNEAISAHLKHSNNFYTCKECHYEGAPAEHMNGNYRDVFNSAYTAGMIAAKAGSTPVLNGDGTCSTVYCHSNGAPRGGSIVHQQTPNWFGGSITTCDRCHQASPATNAHGTHITKGYSCENCHALTATNSNSIKDKSKHADGNKDISFSSANLPFALVNSSYTSADAKCSNVYCHSDGAGHFVTPTWTDASSGQCGTCHETVTRNSGNHQAHLSTGVAYGPHLSHQPVADACNNCHGPDYTTRHINGTNTDFDGSTCSAQCHPKATGLTWGSSTRMSCESCHTSPRTSVVDGRTAPERSLSDTKGHGMNSSNTGVIMNFACTSCHDPNAPHINEAVRSSRLISDLTGSLNAQCTHCHNDTSVVTTFSKQNMPSHLTDNVAGGVASYSSCSVCHDLHGTNNRSMIREKITVAATGMTYDVSYKNQTSMFTTTPNANGIYTGLCQVCHTRTSHYLNNVAETGHYPDNCFNCHKHKQLNPEKQELLFAFAPGDGTCNSCHGYPPVQSLTALGANVQTHLNYSGAKLENYSGGGGVHSVEGHVSMLASTTGGFSNCTNCHYGVQGSHPRGSDPSKPSMITVQVDPKYKFDSRRPITYSGNQVDKPLRNSTGTCSNVSCHFQPTPKWSTSR